MEAPNPQVLAMVPLKKYLIGLIFKWKCPLRNENCLALSKIKIQGLISQSNKIHPKTNCQLLSNYNRSAVKINLSSLWNRPQARHFTDFSPWSFAGLCPVNIGQLAQAKAVDSRGVNVAIDGDWWVSGRRGRVRYLEDLTHLGVQLKVGDGAPVLWGCQIQQSLNCLVKIH